MLHLSVTLRRACRPAGCALVVVCSCLSNSTLAQQKDADTKGCPIEIAVQQVDTFVSNQTSKLSELSLPLLNEMDQLNSKASRPGVAIKDQLSAQDLQRFMQLRHANIQLDIERLKFSDFQRDVHLVYDTYKAVELVDLYDVTLDSLGNADPRRFYIVILQGLRAAQPRTMKTPLINSGIGCDPEAGLYFEEQFYQQQLAKTGADQRTVNMVFDIERLRTLYQLAWNLFNKGIDDVRQTTWKGDDPQPPDNITPMIATSSAATQTIYKTIIPYIDQQLPSEVTLEMRFKQSLVQQATHDYPVQRK